MSSRPITEDDLNGFVDDTLDPVLRAEVVAYLAAHPDIAKQVAGYCVQRDMLRAAFAPILEEPVPAELSLSSMLGERRRRPVSRWAMAAAAAVLLCVGGASGWTLRGVGLPASEGIRSLAQEAAASYAVFAPDLVRPVEIRAEDRAQLVAWTSRRLGRPIAIPDLAVSGYRFMGGRVVATAHGPAALFMYDDDRGTRLVMFARPMAADTDAPMTAHAEHGVNGFAWADGGLGYSLVGSAASASLHPIADEARRQLRSDA
ncbi:MAG TPA: anti-sigma factor [Ancylobacter sp.]